MEYQLLQQMLFQQIQAHTAPNQAHQALNGCPKQGNQVSNQLQSHAKEVWFEERIRDEEEGWRVWGAQEFSKNEEKKKEVRDVNGSR